MFGLPSPNSHEEPGGQDPSGPPGESGWLGASPDPRDEVLVPSSAKPSASTPPTSEGKRTLYVIERTIKLPFCIKLSEVDQPSGPIRVHMRSRARRGGASDGGKQSRLVLFGLSHSVGGAASRDYGMPRDAVWPKPRGRPRERACDRSGSRSTACGITARRTCGLSALCSRHCAHGDECSSGRLPRWVP